MKSNSIFLLLIGICLYPVLFYGQDQSTSVSVNANVQSTIELITINDIRLGSIQPGQVEVVIEPNRDSNSGSMIARGRPNAEISIHYIEEHILTRAEGNETLTFYYQVAGHTEDNQVASEVLDGFSRDMKFNEDGEYFLWVGGRVNIENAVYGAYDGEFTIEIEYL
ncbi:MAG: hypothetical protein WD267_04895 [Balneolales bacterium]